MPVKSIPAWQKAMSQHSDKPATPETSPLDESSTVISSSSKPNISTPQTSEKEGSTKGDNANSPQGGDEAEDDELIAHGISSSDDADPEPNVSSDFAALIETARRFLQDETVKDAPRDKKVAFLVSKGVEHSTADKLVNELSPDEEPGLLSKIGATVFGTSLNEQAIPVSSTPPPIITYPEFLVQSQPSIITTSKIANIVTGATAAMGLIYGISQYVVLPMTETLATARHNFYQTAHGKLVDLNERLSTVVSVIPEGQKPGEASTDDTSSDDGPPLFYRSVGVQTSPSLAAQTYEPDRPEGAIGEEPGVKSDLISEQHQRLRKLVDDISEVSATNTLEGDCEYQLDSAVASISGRLSELAHARAVFHSYPYMLSTYGNRPNGEDQDPFWNLKEDIRTLKGSLLSPRTFTSRRTVHQRVASLMDQTTA